MLHNLLLLLLWLFLVHFGSRSVARIELVLGLLVQGTTALLSSEGNLLLRNQLCALGATQMHQVDLLVPDEIEKLLRGRLGGQVDHRAQRQFGEEREVQCARLAASVQVFLNVPKVWRRNVLRTERHLVD